MRLALVSTALMIVAAVGLLLAGCENTSTVSDVLTVTPASATVTNAGATVMFTVNATTNSTLVLPLTWSVANQSLGTILSSGALTAIYESTGAQGNNTITVRDRANNTGIALVNQPAVAPQSAGP